MPNLEIRADNLYLYDPTSTSTDRKGIRLNSNDAITRNILTSSGWKTITYEGANRIGGYTKPSFTIEGEQKIDLPQNNSFFFSKYVAVTPSVNDNVTTIENIMKATTVVTPHNFSIGNRNFSGDGNTGILAHQRGILEIARDIANEGATGNSDVKFAATIYQVNPVTTMPAGKAIPTGSNFFDAYQHGGLIGINNNGDLVIQVYHSNNSLKRVFRPISNNSIYFGNEDYRWQKGYFVNLDNSGAISTNTLTSSGESILNSLRITTTSTFTGLATFNGSIMNNGGIYVQKNNSKTVAHISGAANLRLGTDLGTDLNGYNIVLTGNNTVVSNQSAYFAGVVNTGKGAHTSDERFKDIVGIIPEEESAIILKNYKPIKFYWKNDENKVLMYGTTAQHLRKILIDNNIENAGLIMYFNKKEGTLNYDLNTKETEENQLSVDYTSLISVLFQGWQMHEKEIEQLKNTIKVLKGGN